MNFTISKYSGLALTLLLPIVGCSSNSDDSKGSGGSTASGGAASNGGSANGGSANGGSASGGAAAGGSASGGAANGGSGTGGSGTAAAPASSSQADITAFLDKGGYKDPSWVVDVASPRPGDSGTQHGDGIRVWENATLVASIKGGRDGWMNRPAPDVGSMAVKEMYDSNGQLVGLAAALRSSATTGFGGWTYYCYAPGARCSSTGEYTKSAPLYSGGGVAPGMTCAICHNSTIFTVPP
ncbi:MAG: hypothetical protein ACOY0T_33235 [Myxococcota bacterium]